LLAGAAPANGTPVWVAGYPEGDHLTVTSGEVLNTLSGSPYGLSGPVLAISAPVQPGSSGSPLLDADGKVVGVVFARDVANRDGLAMPVTTLESLLHDGGTQILSRVRPSKRASSLASAVIRSGLATISGQSEPDLQMTNLGHLAPALEPHSVVKKLGPKRT
jgi:S1-C subfamily serine protease